MVLGYELMELPYVEIYQKIGPLFIEKYSIY